ncbi:MAG: hypothetical protein ACE15F_24735 [bacterium]
MQQENEGRSRLSAQETVGKTSPKRIIGRLLVRLVGLFQIGFGLIWFADEIGFQGHIARWDLAIIMVAAIILGVGLLRVSFVCIVLSLLLYVLSTADQILVFGYRPQLIEMFVVVTPPILLAVGGIFCADSPSTQDRGGANEQ